MDFNEKDLIQLKAQGVSPELIDEQVERFRTGFPPMELLRSAAVGDGILSIGTSELKKLVKEFDTRKSTLDIVKFVPASGAASRMFKSLFAFLHENLGLTNQNDALLKDKEVSKFFEGFSKFAFIPSLTDVMSRNGLNILELLEDGHYAEILEYLLTDKGLNYGNLPKGLLYFHSYGEEIRTPFEEHLVEGVSYAWGKKNVRLHFTVSQDHEALFIQKMQDVRTKYQDTHKVEFEVTYSMQNPSTDTIAVNPDNTPFRNSDNSLLFRPAGHGALLENLNSIKADILFIKNIDNVVPDRIKGPTNDYKKALGALLLRYTDRIHLYLKKLESTSIKQELLDEIAVFIREELNTVLVVSEDREESIRQFKLKLNRPIRICGMVLNTGEAGGGPFWCKNPDGSFGLQVVETSQIDQSGPKQLAILQSSSHFNPVDIVVSFKKADGTYFDLMKYRDPFTGFISEKSKDGKNLKAMELPGLWNGSMSDWNTILLEVPAISFNPVKTVNDLLRDEHQS